MSNENLQPRPPYPIPQHQDNGQNLPSSLNRKVCLRHPGYNDAANTLMTLFALDHLEGGILHETARIACAIIANNQWQGFLTETRSGQPVQVNADGILRGQNYYFRISTDALDDKYPVVPSFSHWRFPHENLSNLWTLCAPSDLPLDQLPRHSTATAASLTRDITCRITNHYESTEHAHLIPRSEQDWFNENGMFRYTNPQRPGIEPIDDGRNAILLRSDVHTVFDAKRFAVVPKSSVLLCHVVAPGNSGELTSLYHNVALQPFFDVAVQFILARFAWTIFAQSAGFMRQGLTINLCIYIGNWETRTAEFSGDQCRELSGGKPRSQSPKKRQRSVNATPAEDGANDNEEDFRGRKRRRNFESPYPDSSYESQGTTTEATLADQSEKINWWERGEDDAYGQCFADLCGHDNEMRYNPDCQAN